jgi:DNA-binding CsgD family transcriptional regulator
MPQDPTRRLLGRSSELESLDALLRDVRDGHSRVLVLRGEAGIGKSVLLDQLAERATGMRTVRTAGVEAESDFTYSALQQLCAPLLPHLDRLPSVQADALRVAFGLAADSTPEVLLVGVAVLGLFSEAAAETPLLCLVDDAQWLDPLSQQILALVGRRLDAESVALVFAERIDDQPAESDLSALPGLLVGGLSSVEGRTLLAGVLPGPTDPRVLNRLVAETGGNPLALLELPRGLSSAELAFGFGRPGSAPLATRVEEGFRRRVEALPADTRTLLLTATLEPSGDDPLLARALRLLDIGPEAAVPAEAAGLLRLDGPVRFRHPLVRSAVWRGADIATLAAVHGALADATDADRDPDRRAWHRAQATGAADEQVALDLARTADRALVRGGQAAAASFLERAAALTPDPVKRARRALAAAQAFLDAGAAERVADLLAAAELGPLDPRQQAEAARLRAHATAMTATGLSEVQPLLDATRQLAALDPAAARKTCLAAFRAAIWAGRSDPDAMRRVAAVAAELPADGTAGGEAAGTADGVAAGEQEADGEEIAGPFLHALSIWALEGPVAGFPLLAEAIRAIAGATGLAVLWPVVTAAAELGDLRAVLDVTDRAVRLARTTGTLAALATAVPYRAVGLAYAGRFAEAEELVADAPIAGSETVAATRTFATVMLSAYRGREQPALAVIKAVERDGERHGQGRFTSIACCARAVLYNGTGNYPLALEYALRGTEYPDLAVAHWAAAELVEAASRTGDRTVAAHACEQLTDWSRSGTSWALGAQAVAVALTGPAGKAEDRYREALDHFEQGGLAVFEARTRLLYGEWLRRQNRRTQARDELRVAHDATAAIGMEAFAERARRELLATGEAVRKRQVGTPVLTPQEAQIARLTVAGNSNAEIGAQLFLSSRTVEWHLRKVYAKVGISSRRELEGALATLNA